MIKTHGPAIWCETSLGQEGGAVARAAPGEKDSRSPISEDKCDAEVGRGKPPVRNRLKNSLSGSPRTPRREAQIIVVQGIGQAFTEHLVYDRQSGQLLTGSLMDYGLPRADEVCSFEMEENPVPTKTNPLGVKGAGEAGNVGALAAILNAVVDALAPLGVTHLDMPATPEKVWPSAPLRQRTRRATRLKIRGAPGTEPFPW